MTSPLKFLNQNTSVILCVIHSYKAFDVRINFTWYWKHFWWFLKGSGFKRHTRLNWRLYLKVCFRLFTTCWGPAQWNLQTLQRKGLKISLAGNIQREMWKNICKCDHRLGTQVPTRVLPITSIYSSMTFIDLIFAKNLQNIFLNFNNNKNYIEIWWWFHRVHIKRFF